METGLTGNDINHIWNENVRTRAKKYFIYFIYIILLDAQNT